ncbi:hypothetical protein CLDAP_02390 [Caldilinea aerophila DSM 14535 = NBRC 104270]|uniref:Uncharacterized protein n=1 Tax=Caldilinea aerophila (strain DSM 14535 / JCM 11387 / NBRC 104270 / STL-6-O1) TaxID=926550 RepID=I0HZ41_CALAS|nr:hypothetical protein CLDAP_02390 [Caldilinea aerophila DSM 14535 = NBRC 104270]
MNAIVQFRRFLKIWRELYIPKQLPSPNISAANNLQPSILPIPFTPIDVAKNTPNAVSKN